MKDKEAKPPEGYLSQKKGQEILSPIYHFDIFKGALVFRLIYDLFQVENDDAIYRVFNYTNSAGSGAGAIYGNSDFKMVLIERKNGLFPHFFIRPRNFVNKLKALFSKKIDFNENPKFKEKFIVTGDDPKDIVNYINIGFQNHLLKILTPPSIEADGKYLIAYERGPIQAHEKVKFLEKIKSLSLFLRF